MKRKNTKTFTLIHRRLTPSGYWSNSSYKISDETVEIPVTKLGGAIIIRDVILKGVSQSCTRLIIDGKTYLVEGTL